MEVYFVSHCCERNIYFYNENAYVSYFETFRLQQKMSQFFIRIC